MNGIAKFYLWTIVFGLIFLVSIGSVSAQKATTGGWTGTLAEDTAINPHDFTNDYYAMNGIVGKAIYDRRTGTDGLSVLSRSSNPYHTDVRIIATMPAYDQSGETLFWYPLGQVDVNGFTADRIGAEMLEMAKLYPIYVFPDTKVQEYSTFANTRQAALMDNTWSLVTGKDLNPLGFREIVFVTFSEKAFTEDGAEMMNYMAKKNGMSSDDTPIIPTLEDLLLLMKYELVITSVVKGPANRFAIAPMISDPTNGVIAKDAYLWFATKDGTPLPTERMFEYQFTCLQKTGSWCKE